jgi:hypothetical protein
MPLPYGTLQGAQPFNYSSAYGGVPQVPDPFSSQANALAGNTNNLSALYGLAAPINQFQMSQAIGQLDTAIPGYSGMIGQSGQNIEAELRGELPQDVINQLGRRGAERGIAMGSPDSPNTKAAYLQALGLTSLDQIRHGESDLTAAMGRAPKPTLFDPMSMIVGPMEAQIAQYMANLYKAAPAPADAAAAAMAALRGQGGYGGGRTTMGGGSGGGIQTDDWRKTGRDWIASHGWGSGYDTGRLPSDYPSGEVSTWGGVGGYVPGQTPEEETWNWLMGTPQDIQNPVQKATFTILPGNQLTQFYGRISNASMAGRKS